MSKRLHAVTVYYFLAIYIESNILVHVERKEYPVKNAFYSAVTVFTVLIFLAVPCFIQPTWGKGWPCFRGPGGMGVSNASGLPLSWSDEQNMLWRIDLPGPGSSSPVVYGDRIYIASYSGYQVPGQQGGSLEDLRRHLLAVSKADGHVIWEKIVPAKLPEEKRIRDHGYAAHTPAADEEGVVVFFGKTGVFAYDHKGNSVWQADVGDGTNGWGTGSSPVFYRDLVFVNASVESAALVALDRKTGRERWRAGGIKAAWDTPVIVKTTDGADELVMSIQRKVLAFDPLSGEALWSCDTDITWYMVPSVVAHNGVVYVLGGRSGTAGLAVRAGGRGDVTQTHRLWTSQKGSNVTSPVFHDGHLYWMHESRGIAYCAESQTGNLVYEQRLERAGQVYASALLAGDRIYYMNRRGKTFVVAAKPAFELLATNELSDGGKFDGSPAVDGNRLLVRSDKYLYCLGE